MKKNNVSISTFKNGKKTRTTKKDMELLRDVGNIFAGKSKKFKTISVEHF